MNYTPIAKPESRLMNYLAYTALGLAAVNLFGDDVVRGYRHLKAVVHSATAESVPSGIEPHLESEMEQIKSDVKRLPASIDDKVAKTESF